MQEHYSGIFNILEETLQKQSGLSTIEFKAKYAQYRELTFRNRTDDEYFEILKPIVFYSGFSAETVNARLHTINKHLPNFKAIMILDESQIAEILSDSEMLKNKRKVTATVQNALVFQKIIISHGSFQNYIDSFKPSDCFENLMIFKEELQYTFNFLGAITVYHFLTEIGLPVLKPDRVLVRIYKRLGLIEDEKQLLKTVLQGRKFAEKTGHCIRYIDIIFVSYGARNDKGICLSEKPKCELCGLKSQCNFFKKASINLDQ